jgi:hypothetical protein
MSSRKKHRTVRDTMRKEYRFDYSQAKPNRFREETLRGEKSARRSDGERIHCRI